MTPPKLRVLQVGKYYPPARGGMETVLEVLCQGLKNEVDLEVLVANETAADVDEMANGVFVRRVGSACKIAGNPICPRLRRAMRAAGADVVHLHLPNPVALLTHYFSGIPGKLVCSYHSDIVRQRILERLIRPLQNRALDRASAIVSSSPNLIEASPILRRLRDKCVVIPFGMNVEAELPQREPEVAELRRRFGSPLLLAAGRLVYYKGFDVLIEAFARVPAPCSLVIIGGGPLRAALQARIDRLGQSDRIHLIGNVPDTVPYYQACDVFVLSSIACSEAFGMVQLEAMLCGKAVINTQLNSGVPFVSLHGETGLTVPPGDVPALAQAIRQLLFDAALRDRYGRAGRQRVHEVFNARRMVEKMLELYRQITQGSAPQDRGSQNPGVTPRTEPR